MDDPEMQLSNKGRRNQWKVYVEVPEVGGRVIPVAVDAHTTPLDILQHLEMFTDGLHAEDATRQLLHRGRELAKEVSLRKQGLGIGKVVLLLKPPTKHVFVRMPSGTIEFLRMEKHETPEHVLQKLAERDGVAMSLASHRLVHNDCDLEHHVTLDEHGVPHLATLTLERPMSRVFVKHAFNMTQGHPSIIPVEVNLDKDSAWDVVGLVCEHECVHEDQASQYALRDVSTENLLNSAACLASSRSASTTARFRRCTSRGGKRSLNSS